MNKRPPFAIPHNPPTCIRVAPSTQRTPVPNQPTIPANTQRIPVCTPLGYARPANPYFRQLTA